MLRLEFAVGRDAVQLKNTNGDIVLEGKVRHLKEIQQLLSDARDGVTHRIVAAGLKEHAEKSGTVNATTEL